MQSREKQHALDKKEWAWQWCKIGSCIILQIIHSDILLTLPSMMPSCLYSILIYLGVSFYMTCRFT